LLFYFFNALATIQASQINGNTRNKDIEQINSIIEKTRDLASGLRPSTLEVLGLTTSIKTLARSIRQHYKLKIIIRLGNLDSIKFQGDVINLYRIIQEGLTNITKHAQATEVIITAKRLKNRLIVEIRDNGKGIKKIKQQYATSNSKGLGLSTMRERAKLLNGDININFKSGKGTSILLDIPIGKVKVNNA